MGYRILKFNRHTLKKKKKKITGVNQLNVPLIYVVDPEFVDVSRSADGITAFTERNAAPFWLKRLPGMFLTM